MRYWAILLLVVLLAGTAFAAEPYRIGVLRGPTAVAFAPVLREPVVLEDGRTVQFLVMPSPDVLIARLISGDVDAATIPSNAAAQLYNRGVDLQVAATFIWGVLYLVGPPGAVLDDASGSEIYSIGRGATPDLVLRYILEKKGLLDAVTVRYGLSQVELAQLLIAGRAGLAVLPEPFVTRVLQATPDRVVIADLQALWNEATGEALPQTVLVTVGTQTRAVRGELVALLRTSIGMLEENPQATLGDIEELGLGLDTDTAVAALPRLNLHVETGRESRPALAEYFSVLQNFDSAAIGGALPDDAFYGE